MPFDRDGKSFTHGSHCRRDEQRRLHCSWSTSCSSVPAWF